MTPKCVKEVDRLQAECEAFNDLTLEQLLYAGITGVDLDDVVAVLAGTDWSKWAGDVGGYKPPSKGDKRLKRMGRLILVKDDEVVEVSTMHYSKMVRTLLQFLA